ncbi:MAG: hypothetical protein IJ110_06270 [Lachnospiraceae bacterium]|nr:hypothetical protein [Lachnospiraceae bacterium]
MFHTDLWDVVRHLGAGNVGLEKEALRITEDGFLAQTRDPFVGNPNIVKDFSENQTEINTPVCSSTAEAVGSLEEYSVLIRKTIGQMPEPELLWPFSNPPYIRDDSEIPVAQYEGADRVKTEYRNYLAERYGKYMMTFSGIHFNYSFSDELLKAEYEAVRSAGAGAGGSAECGADAAEAVSGGFAERGAGSFRDFKDHFYVSLAAKMLVYNWLIVAVTAASPILDISYLEKGKKGQSVFGGLASVRCSERGYWNFFTPVLDYSNLEKYAESILGYIRYGIIRSESELYFPVRIKPAGKYDVAKMAREGVSHIELRMIDLNPYERGGMDVRDAEFIKLLLIYVAALPELEVTAHEQILAVNNTKSAAHYDIDEVKIVLAGSETMELRAAALCVIGKMEAFFAEVGEPFGLSEGVREAKAVLAYQRRKFEVPEARYAFRVRKEYGEGFVEKGLKLAKEYSKI